MKLSKLWHYLRLMGWVLLLQGSAALVWAVLPNPAIGFPNVVLRLLQTDPLHALIHVGWGMFLLKRLNSPTQEPTIAPQSRIIQAGWAFGIFYMIMGITGILVHHPLGMRLDRGENLFHFVSASIALLFAARSTARIPEYK